MARPLLIRTKSFAYHVRTRSNNRDWFHLPLDRLWELMCSLMRKTISLYGPEIHAFVLMNNHLHLILTTPEANLDAVMQYFIRESAKAICRESGRINRIFGGRYQRSIIANEVYFKNVFKYVLRNPVAAGICARPEDYEFSTLPWTLKTRAPKFLLSEEPSYLFKALPQGSAFLPWLGTSYSQKQSAAIRSGLRQAKFQWPTGKNYRSTVKSLAGNGYPEGS